MKRVLFIFQRDIFYVAFLLRFLRLYVLQVEATKKKVKKTNVPVVELVYGGMSAEELQKAVEKEFEMALQDRVMEETKDKKNAVEAYVYDMRNKVICLSLCFRCTKY